MKTNGEPFICVYAICKNEEKFIDRWIGSLKDEADCIVVLDTGSTDKTVELLEQYSNIVIVEQKIITPWRFDTARNESMKLIPENADICVVSDCDQVFRPGWGDILRDAYKRGVEEVYGPIIDYDDNNQEIKRFLSKNVHPNKKEWYWERPIHEGISFHGDREIIGETNDNFVIEHHPDTTKSRDGYLKLLEEEYKENSRDPMCAIYYGCELCFHGRDDEGLEIFLRAYEECDFTNYPEVGYQICLNIAESMLENNQLITALDYAQKAESYGVYTRRLYMSISNCFLKIGRDAEAVDNIHKALAIKTENKTWVESNYWYKGGCYDSLSLIYYSNKKYDKAVLYGALAISEDPENQRFKDNIKFYISKFKEVM